MSQKKYASLNNLQIFLDNIKTIFATKIECNKVKSYSDDNLEIAKSYSDSNSASTLSSAQSYTDNSVAQKSQVQIITWGDDD